MLSVVPDAMFQAMMAINDPESAKFLTLPPFSVSVDEQQAIKEEMKRVAVEIIGQDEEEEKTYTSYTFEFRDPLKFPKIEILILIMLEYGFIYDGYDMDMPLGNMKNQVREYSVFFYKETSFVEKFDHVIDSLEKQDNSSGEKCKELIELMNASMVNRLLVLSNSKLPDLLTTCIKLVQIGNSSEQDLAMGVILNLTYCEERYKELVREKIVKNEQLLQFLQDLFVIQEEMDESTIECRRQIAAFLGNLAKIDKFTRKNIIFSPNFTFYRNLKNCLIFRPDTCYLSVASYMIMASLSKDDDLKEFLLADEELIQIFIKRIENGEPNSLQKLRAVGCLLEIGKRTHGIDEETGEPIDEFKLFPVTSEFLNILEKAVLREPKGSPVTTMVSLILRRYAQDDLSLFENEILLNFMKRSCFENEIGTLNSPVKSAGFMFYFDRVRTDGHYLNQHPELVKEIVTSLKEENTERNQVRSAVHSLIFYASFNAIPLPKEIFDALYDAEFDANCCWILLYQMNFLENKQAWVEKLQKTLEQVPSASLPLVLFYKEEMNEQVLEEKISSQTFDGVIFCLKTETFFKAVLVILECVEILFRVKQFRKKIQVKDFADLTEVLLDRAKDNGKHLYHRCLVLLIKLTILLLDEEDIESYSQLKKQVNISLFQPLDKFIQERPENLELNEEFPKLAFFFPVNEAVDEGKNLFVIVEKSDENVVQTDGDVQRLEEHVERDNSRQKKKKYRCCIS